MQNGAGDIISPFSKFVDEEKISDLVSGKHRPASPGTVTKVITLPSSQNKRAMKTYLREKLFPVGHDIRSVLFKTLAKRVECSTSMFNEQMYTDFVAENSLHDKTSSIPLPSYVDVTNEFPVYYLNNIGVCEAKKLLACIGFHFPHISFSPILPFIISLLLHYDDSPSQVFGHACHLMFSNSKSVHYLDQTKQESMASALLLKELSQRYASTSHKSLLNLTSDPESVYNQWIKCLFLGLPFKTIVILFDMYLLEGYKALYRVALAILKFYRKVGISDPSDIASAVFEFCQIIDTKVSTPLLFRKAFSFKLPSSKEIKKMHQKIQMSLTHKQLDSDVTVYHRNPWDYLSVVKEVTSNIVNESLLSTLYCWIPETEALNKPKLLFSTENNGYNIQTFFSCIEEHEPTILLIKTLNDEVIGAYLPSAWIERKDDCGFFGTGETFIFSLLPETKVCRWVEITGSKDNTNAAANQNVSLNKNDKVLPPVKPPTGTSKDGWSVTLPPIHRDTRNTSSPAIRISDPVSLPPLVGSSCLHTPPPNNKPEVTQPKGDLFMMADSRGIMVGGGGGSYGLFIDSALKNGFSNHCTTFNNKPLLTGENFTCSVVEVFGFDTGV
uniref:Oxidation resistance protein 1 n=1 Tax=Phallusia mammillata TaxID=59560 RepID=A0A6F9DVD1_9ASCI|nr:TBC1 domain family member 24-like [Phallusia mammillata]